MNFIKKHYFLNKEPNYKDNQGIDYLFKTPFELQRNANNFYTYTGCPSYTFKFRNI